MTSQLCPLTAIRSFTLFKVPISGFKDRPTAGLRLSLHLWSVSLSDCYRKPSVLTFCEFNARSFWGRLNVLLPCQGKLSLCPSTLCLSVSNVEASWSYRLEFCKNNFTADKPNLFTICGPQHDGSIPKGTPSNFSRNRSGVGEIVDCRHFSRCISETVLD